MIHAERDVHALRSLEGPQLASYVETRQYLRPLWCDCGPATKVGQGQIRPDGTFHICWSEPLWYLRANCHYEYAFVVKQASGGSTITIYDGLANRWFDDRTGIRLVSYDPRARGCRDNVFPESGAFALLEDIGAAHSYRLKSPVQDTWDGVQGPLAYNDGLLDPAANAAAAGGSTSIATGVARSRCSTTSASPCATRLRERPSTGSASSRPMPLATRRGRARIWTAGSRGCTTTARTSRRRCSAR